MTALRPSASTSKPNLKRSFPIVKSDAKHNLLPQLELVPHDAANEVHRASFLFIDLPHKKAPTPLKPIIQGSSLQHLNDVGKLSATYSTHLLKAW